MAMGDRLGIGGLIVALIGIAIAILWPDKRWIGWTALGFAAVLGVVWAWSEFVVDASKAYGLHPIASTLVIFVCSGLIGSGLWVWVVASQSSSKSQQEEVPKDTTPAVKPIPNAPAPKGTQVAKSGPPEGIPALPKPSMPAPAAASAQISAPTKAPEASQITTMANSEILRVQVDATTLINKSDEWMRHYRAEIQGASVLPATVREPITDKLHASLYKWYRETHLPEARRVRQELLGHIHDLPQTADQDLYRELQPGEPPVTKDVDGQIDDLRRLLNEMESEYGLPLTKPRPQF